MPKIKEIAPQSIYNEKEKLFCTKILLNETTLDCRIKIGNFLEKRIQRKSQISSNYKKISRIKYLFEIQNKLKNIHNIKTTNYKRYVQILLTHREIAYQELVNTIYKITTKITSGTFFSILSVAGRIRKTSWTSDAVRGSTPCKCIFRFRPGNFWSKSCEIRMRNEIELGPITILKVLLIQRFCLFWKSF